MLQNGDLGDLGGQGTHAMSTGDTPTADCGVYVDGAELLFRPMGRYVGGVDFRR